MATEKDLRERMKKLDEHLAQVKAELAEMDEDQRVELGGILEEISETLTRRGKG